MTENQIITQILDAAFKVHSALGPGLLEKAYEVCLIYELKKMGLKVESQKPLPLIYDGQEMGVDYKLDLLVEGKVLVELKTVDAFHDLHTAQVITYLRLSNLKYGLLLNFKAMRMKEGIKRVVNG